MDSKSHRNEVPKEETSHSATSEIHFVCATMWWWVYSAMSDTYLDQLFNWANFRQRQSINIPLAQHSFYCNAGRNVCPKFQNSKLRECVVPMGYQTYILRLSLLWVFYHSFMETYLPRINASIWSQHSDYRIIENLGMWRGIMFSLQNTALRV